MRLEFFVPMIPPTITAQQARLSTGRRPYKTQELKNARLKLRDHIGRFAPDKPFDGPLRLVVKWCWPIAKGRRHGQYKHTRPDTDNLQKMLKDVMTELGYWVDDSRVASEIVEKFWADPPGLYIAVEELVT